MYTLSKLEIHCLNLPAPFLWNIIVLALVFIYKSYICYRVLGSILCFLVYGVDVLWTLLDWAVLSRRPVTMESWAGGPRLFLWLCLCCEVSTAGGSTFYSQQHKMFISTVPLTTCHALVALRQRSNFFVCFLFKVHNRREHSLCIISEGCFHKLGQRGCVLCLGCVMKACWWLCSGEGSKTEQSLL